MTQSEALFYGKYRGEVVTAEDPLRLGRVKVSVPGVCRDAWALPCTPFAGPSVAFSVKPPARASVWVEFEAGDPGKPIVVGYYWDRSVAPVLDAAIELAPGEIKLRCGSSTVRVSGAGVEISCSDVSLRLDSAKIAASCGSVALDLSNAGVDLAAGNSTSASFHTTEVKLTSGVVQINDGALKVI